MELLKEIKFLNNLPVKLNRFYKKKSKKKFVIRDKSKKTGGNFDPVTDLDRSIERYVRDLLLSKFKEDGVNGEEFKIKNSNNNRRWIIDPIDGTKAFISGLPTWSNLIGYSYKNKSLIGLANFPELKRYYISDKKKSYVFFDNKRKIIKSSKNKKKGLLIVGNFYGNSKKINKLRIIKILGPSLKQIKIDALSYCLLAEGKLDAVIETNLKTFDISPLIPILKNSGAVVSNWKNKSAENGGNIIASRNKKIHIKLLKILNS